MRSSRSRTVVGSRVSFRPEAPLVPVLEEVIAQSVVLKALRFETSPTLGLPESKLRFVFLKLTS